MSLKKINSIEFELLVNCAVRYALGRRTYVVSEICNFLIERKKDLSINCIKTILSDIKNQIDLSLGDRCDEKEWMNLLNTLGNFLIEKEAFNNKKI